jgi:hypothetical protein
MPGFTSVDVSYGPLCPVSSLSFRHACDLLWPALKEGGDPRLTMGDAVTAIGLAGAGRRVVLHSESVAWRKEVRGAAGSITTRLCHLIGSSTAFDGATYRQLYPDVVSLQDFPNEVKNLDMWWGRVLNAWLMMLNAVATPHRTEAEQSLSTLYGLPDDPTDFSAPPGRRHTGLLRDGIDWLTNQYNRYWSRTQYEVKFRGFFDAVRIHINESKVKPAKENIFSQTLFAPTKFHFTGEQLAIIYREARNVRKFMRNAQIKVAQAEFQRNPVIEFGDIAVNLRELPPQPLPQFAQLSLREFPPLPAPEVPKQKMLDLPRMPFPPLPSQVST